MRHDEIRLSRGFRYMLLVAALTVVGCGTADRRYEADYGYEILKKSPDGTVTVVDKGAVERAAAGDGGGGEIPGTGRIHTRVLSLSADTASIEIVLPGGSIAELDLSPKKTTEHFPEGSTYGIRITVGEIRKR